VGRCVPPSGTRLRGCWEHKEMTPNRLAANALALLRQAGGQEGSGAVTDVFQEVGEGPVLWRGESEAAGDREKALPDVQKLRGGRQRHGVVRHPHSKRFPGGEDPGDPAAVALSEGVPAGPLREGAGVASGVPLRQLGGHRRALRVGPRPLLRRYPDLVRAIGAWSSSESLWIRRASAVSLVPLVRRGEHLGPTRRPVPSWPIGKISSTRRPGGCCARRGKPIHGDWRRSYGRRVGEFRGRPSGTPSSDFPRAAGGRSFARRASLPPSRTRRRRFPTTAWPTG